MFFTDCIHANNTQRRKGRESAYYTWNRSLWDLQWPFMALDKSTETNYLIPQPALNLQEKPLLCLRIREARRGLHLDNMAVISVHLSGQTSKPWLWLDIVQEKQSWFGCLYLFSPKWVGVAFLVWPLVTFSSQPAGSVSAVVSAKSWKLVSQLQDNGVADLPLEFI